MRTSVASMTLLGALFSILSLSGCAHIPNQWVEDGPAITEDCDTPTVKVLREQYSPAQLRQRDWEPVTLSTEAGACTHWPLYMEDPFEDKGAGREDPNKYHIGWEDYVAMPYCYARYTLNWLMRPLSMVVTPPWTLMASDGRLSKQCLGYDHDATRAEQ